MGIDAETADGHPAPFHLSHVELGNEEQVNDDYWRKFKPMAEAMWAAARSPRR